MNTNHVNAFKTFTGVGIVPFGARTLSRGAVDQYIPARRSLKSSSCSRYITRAMSS